MTMLKALVWYLPGLLPSLVHLSNLLGIKCSMLKGKLQVGIKIDHLDKKIDNIEIRMRENLKDIVSIMRENQKDIESKMIDNQKELMAVINPLVVKVQVLEERFADIRNK
ncbi:hypothetical protein MP638_001791 [Amoeboaphelidium occidentale]|nr:hypothetical protein MP638_001791 [Amoeboaphelidium occidentale]